MIKNIVLFLIIISTCGASISQNVDFVLNVTEPGSILVENNILYFIKNNVNRIVKMDLSDSTKTQVTVVGGLSNPTGLAIYGNYLYFIQKTPQNHDGWISRVNIATGSSVVDDVITGYNNPCFLAVRQNELFISDPSSNTISKINLDVVNPVGELVVDNLDTPFGMAVKGDFLYVAEAPTYQIITKISKINVTLASPYTTTVYSGDMNPVGLHFHQNILYFTDAREGTISKMEVAISNPIPELLVDNLEWPVGLSFANATDLYFAQHDVNRISKVSFRTLSNEENNSKLKLNVFPSPSSNFIQISGLEQLESYTIYDISGKSLIEGRVSINDKIHVSNLASGVYFINLANGNVVKFIKG